MKKFTTLFTASLFLTLVFVAGSQEKAISHCEIPCGIFDDGGKFDEFHEDVDTIEKAMNQINDLSSDPSSNANQLIRWVMNKEEHAENIKEEIAHYFFSQRIKFPKDDSEESRENYLSQLELVHQITVYAMKTKQTTDLGYVTKLRDALNAYQELYESVHGHAG